jgi:hypothetical protein
VHEMTPELRQKLQDALIATFDTKELLQFATVRLSFDDVKFADVVNFNQSSTRIAFDLVNEVERHGYLETLLRKLQEARPKVPQVVELMTAFDLQPEIVARPFAGDTSALVRDAVIRFNDRFQQRQKLLGYLNAYKQLHDVLHSLQDFHAQLVMTVDGIRRAPSEILDMGRITDPLDIWVVVAQESIRGTEFPDKPPRWIARFKKAVDDLEFELSKPEPAAIDGAKLDRAIEILAHLPAEEQRGLNVQLVQCAMRLETDELVELMDRILTDAGKAGVASAETNDLRIGVGDFRILCRGLAELIEDHNLCQDVDGALREALGLPEISPDRLSQWSDIRAWLREIGGRHPGSRPDDIRAKRPLETLLLFEAAAAAGDKLRAKRLFDRLEERFNDLFFNADKALLRVTQDLLAAARALDATLKRFL